MTRREAIIQHLRDAGANGATVRELVEATDMSSTSVVHHHLRFLQSAEMVEKARRGSFRLKRRGVVQIQGEVVARTENLLVLRVDGEMPAEGQHIEGELWTAETAP